MDKITKNDLTEKEKIIAHLLDLLKAHDECTLTHCQRVARIACNFASALQMPPSFVTDIGHASLLHDIGKLMIPQYILQKPERLTAAEYRRIQKHAAFGFRIVVNTFSLRELAPVVLYHHEYFDGSGYPEGRKRTDIPFLARILSVIDVYEAITSDRVYRKAMTEPEALRILAEGKGILFDPDVVDAFLQCIGSGFLELS